MDNFSAVAANPLVAVRQWKEIHKKPVIGCMPMYIAEEIIAAADMLPVTLPGKDARVVKAGAYMHTYSCHALKGNFDAALNNEYDFLDGLVFADLCDQSKRLSNIWELYSPYAFSFHMRLPKRLDTPLAIEYYRDELGRFRSALETHFKRQISDAALRASIKLYNEVRELISSLYEMRKKAPESFAPAEIDGIVTAAMVMPKDEFKQSLTDYVSKKKPAEGAKAKGPRLFVVGNPCEDMEPGLLDMIAEVGGVIVDDYVYSGSMYLGPKVSETGDPVESLARAYIGSAPCPTKHSVESWADYLVGRAREDGVDGVVIVMPKYCEVYAFDYPDAKQKLTAAGIPHLMLEVEHAGADGRLKTRLEAFIEMLR